MSYEVWLLLIGAGIGLVSSIAGAFVQHFLSLRAERKKMEWDREERDSERLRAELSGRTSLLTYSGDSVYQMVTKRRTFSAEEEEKQTEGPSEPEA